MRGQPLLEEVYDRARFMRGAPNWGHESITASALYFPIVSLGSLDHKMIEVDRTSEAS